MAKPSQRSTCSGCSTLPMRGGAGADCRLRDGLFLVADVLALPHIYIAT